VTVPKVQAVDKALSGQAEHRPVNRGNKPVDKVSLSKGKDNKARRSKVRANKDNNLAARKPVGNSQRVASRPAASRHLAKPNKAKANNRVISRQTGKPNKRTVNLRRTKAPKRVLIHRRKAMRLLTVQVQTQRKQLQKRPPKRAPNKLLKPKRKPMPLMSRSVHWTGLNRIVPDVAVARKPAPQIS